jgi:O-antigen ligase
MTLRVSPPPDQRSATLEPLPKLEPLSEHRSPFGPDGRRRHTDAYRLCRAFVFILAATALDVSNFLDKGNEARYALLLVPIAMVLLVRRKGQPIRRLTKPDKILLALFVIGFTGTMVGTFILGTKSGARPIFLPMTIAFLYLGTREDPTRQELRSLLRALAWVGLIYASLSALTHLSSFIPWAPLLRLAAFRQYKNATLLYLVMGLSATIMLRWKLRALLMVLLALFIFRAYPSGTAALIAVTTLVTVYVTRRGRMQTRRWVAGVIVVSGLGLAVLNFSGSLSLTEKYFALVGKRDNNGTRLALWQAGIDEFKKSPVEGSLFTGPTVIFTTREGQHKVFQLPFHNDYILFLVEGGLLGLSLLLAWVIATELLMLRRYRAYLELGERSRAALMRTLLIGFNAFFVAAAFNPLFTGMSSSATIFAIYGIMMSLGAPDRLAASE